VIEAVIERWHGILHARSPEALDDLLADDVVFYSPIVFTPQRGKDITTLYLSAAMQTLGGSHEAGDGFRYTKQVLSGDTAVLEFETTVDGKYVNGVDIIRANADGRIVEFRVMLRPLQAVNVVHERMRAMLEELQQQ
jgi:ketosteroid isomerase-like protein